MTRDIRLTFQTPELAAQSFECALRPVAQPKAAASAIKLVKELAALDVPAAQESAQKLEREAYKLRNVVHLCVMKSSETEAPAFRRVDSYDDYSSEHKTALKSGLRCIIGQGCSDEQAEEVLRKSFSSESDLLALTDKVLGAGVLEPDYAERLLNRRELAQGVYQETVEAAPLIVAHEVKQLVSQLLSDGADSTQDERDAIMESLFKDRDEDQRLGKAGEQDADKKEERRRRKVKIKLCRVAQHQHAGMEEEGEECSEPVVQTSNEFHILEINEERFWAGIDQAIAEDCQEEQMEETQEEVQELCEFQEEVEEQELFEKFFDEHPEFANLAIAIGLSQRDWTEEKSQLFLDSMVAWYLQRRAALAQAA